jgi:SAM-dependent methyltransferase
MLRRFLARQFARPSGWWGPWLIAPWLDRISGPMRRLALETLDPRPGERVLELGFGGGALLAALLRAGAEPIGVDLSDAAVARARRRFPGVEIHCASAEALPLPDSSVDKAVSLNSLYFWPDLDAALRELARAVRPCGTLLLGYEPPEELRKWPGHVHGFRLYDTSELVRAAGEAGFGDPDLVSGTGRKPDFFLCLSLTRLADTERP